MKLIDRQAVEGTEPVIYIGHRPYKDKETGKQRISRTWYAEYCLDGRRRYEALRTTNKKTAIRAAHRIVHRIEEGKPTKPSRRRSIEDLCSAYMDEQRHRGLAPRTLGKYDDVLKKFHRWAGENGNRLACAPATTSVTSTPWSGWGISHRTYWTYTTGCTTPWPRRRSARSPTRKPATAANRPRPEPGVQFEHHPFSCQSICLQATNMKDRLRRVRYLPAPDHIIPTGRPCRRAKAALRHILWRVTFCIPMVFTMSLSLTR